MKFCRCNNYEHNEYNIDCPHNDKMDFVLFTRAISENFSLDGKQRWSDSDVINFMIEDDKCNDMIMRLIATNFHKFAAFTLEDVADWEERVINKKKVLNELKKALFLVGDSPIPPYDPEYKGD